MSKHFVTIIIFFLLLRLVPSSQLRNRVKLRVNLIPLALQIITYLLLDFVFALSTVLSRLYEVERVEGWSARAKVDRLSRTSQLFFYLYMVEERASEEEKIQFQCRRTKDHHVY